MWLAWQLVCESYAVFLFGRSERNNTIIEDIQISVKETYLIYFLCSNISAA